MSKIYCEKCGYKIYNTGEEFCPQCGARIQSYSEVQNAERNKRIRNTILIVGIIAIIIVCGWFTYQHFFNQQYQTVQISKTTSLEMPVGKGINSTELGGYIHQITNNDGVVIYTYNSQDKSMSGAIAFSEMKTQAVNNPHNDNQIVEHEENGKTVYSITYANTITHDNIIITAHSKDVAQRIFDSIQADNITKEGNTTGNGTVSSGGSYANNEGKTPYAYADDGSPIWSKSDYDQYQFEVHKYRQEQLELNSPYNNPVVDDSGQSDGGVQSSSSSSSSSSSVGLIVFKCSHIIYYI